MAKKGRITRDEIAEKKVLDLGKDYAKSLKPAIVANEKWLESFGPIKKAAQEYAKLEKQFKISKSRKEFLQLKQQEEKVRNQSIKNVQEEQKLLQQFNKVKQEEQKYRTQNANAAKAEEKAKQSVIDTDKKQLQLETQIHTKKKRSIKLTEEEKLEIRLLNRGKRESAVISSKLSTEYEKQAVKLIRLKREYKDVALTQGQTSDKAEKLRKEIQKLDTALKGVDAGVGEYQRNVGNYKSALSGAARAARSLAQEMGALGGAFLVVSVVRDAFKRIREFNKEMQKLAGITGESREELADIEETIKDVAAASISTSNDIAKLATVLFQLGKTKDEVKLLLEPVNNLALGLDTTAEMAGEFLVQTLNAFGKGSESGQEFADKIAKISISTALNFQRMVDSFQYLAPVAKAVGLTIDDVGAIIGVLNDNGIKAQRAGRLMGTAFQRLGKQGLSLTEALDKVSEIQTTTTDKFEALGKVSKIFGSESAGLALILANSREDIDAYRESFENAGGALETLTNKQLKSLDAQLKILDSAWEDYILDTNDATGASNALRDAVSFLAENLKSIINTLLYATTVWAGYKTVMFLSRLQAGLMSKAMAAQTLVVRANARGISTASVAWIKFNRVVKANALGIAVVALAGLIYLLTKYNKSLEEIHKANQQQFNDFKKNAAAKRQNIEETNNLIDRYDELKSKTKLNKDEQGELNGILLKLKDTVPYVAKEFNEYGKVIGINTTKIREMNSAQLEGLKYQSKVGLESNKKELENLIEQRESVRSQIEVLKSREGNSFLGIKIFSDENFADAFNKLNSISEKITETKITITEYEEQLKDVNNTLKNGNKTAEDEIEIKQKQVLTVQQLKDKISKLNKEKSTLTINDKARAQEIKNSIADYQKQIDAILGVSKANKTAEQTAKERLAAEKKLAADAFALQKYILEQKILGQNEITESEDASWEERKTAIKDRANFQRQLAKLVTVEKLEQTKEFSDKALKQLKADGFLTKEQIRNLTDEQLLIYKQYQARKAEITGQKEGGQDDLEIEKIKENAKIKQLEIEEAMNNEIAAQIEAFNRKEGIYADELTAVENLEKEKARIKIFYAKQALNGQVAAIQKLIDSDQLSKLEQAEAEKNLAAIRKEIAGLTLENFKLNKDKTVDYEKLTTERILDIAGRLAGALKSLADSIFEARISKIDAEIEKNNEKYERWLANEQLTEQQRKEIEKKRQKEEEELRKKKQKIKRKQAIADKAMAIIDIGISTAMGIMQAYAQLGPIGGTIAAALIGVIGTIQTAAVIAKPIPKYVLGTQNHPGGPAEVGEERPEVVTEPGKDPYVVSKPTILDLPKGTKVTPSLEEYERLMKASILSNIDIDNKKLNDFQARQVFNHNNDKLLQEMQLSRKAFEKQKQPIHFHERKIDIDHAIWRSNNIKWD